MNVYLQAHIYHGIMTCLAQQWRHAACWAHVQARQRSIFLAESHERRVRTLNRLRLWVSVLKLVIDPQRSVWGRVYHRRYLVFQHRTRLYRGAASVRDIPFLTVCCGLIVRFGNCANMLHTALCHPWAVSRQPVATAVSTRFQISPK